MRNFNWLIPKCEPGPRGGDDTCCVARTILVLLFPVSEIYRAETGAGTLDWEGAAQDEGAVICNLSV